MNKLKAILLTPVVIAITIVFTFLIPILTFGFLFLIVGYILYMLINDYLEEQNQDE
jgi:phage shock protein PspC (stress-responsive transcriptional regulator)